MRGELSRSGLPGQCVKDFILCMFYTKQSPSSMQGASSEMSLRILTSVFVHLTKWSPGDLRAPYWRLYWNDRTGGAIIVGKKTIPLERTRFVLIPPEVSFTTRLTGTTNHFYVHFLTSLTWSGVDAEVLSASPSDLEAVNHALQEKNPASCACQVASLVTSQLARLTPEKWQVPADMDARVQSAIQKIEAQIPGVPCISRLAKEAGMNTNAFIRLFRERTGHTPALYARERRIEAACLLLHHSAKSIEEIASACGFCDRYHFTHAFIRSRKTSPAAFRKQLRR
jgi:AraC-like DNA-binding protein